MLSRFLQASCHARPIRPGRLILETLAIAVLGAVIALAGNQLKDSKNRFDITRNYFSLPKTTDSKDEEPFRRISHDDTMAAFQSEEFEDGRCIFVDARNDEAYAEKHIPSAYQLDHYFADRYLDEIIPVCQEAEQIIVYCNGGKCEDSKLATLDLIERGIDPEKLFVYMGGVVAWSEDGLPFERGERLSGDVIYDDED